MIYILSLTFFYTMQRDQNAHIHRRNSSCCTKQHCGQHVSKYVCPNFSLFVCLFPKSFVESGAFVSVYLWCVRTFGITCDCDCSLYHTFIFYFFGGVPLFCPGYVPYTGPRCASSCLKDAVGRQLYFISLLLAYFISIFDILLLPLG